MSTQGVSSRYAVTDEPLPVLWDDSLRPRVYYWSPEANGLDARTFRQLHRKHYSEFTEGFEVLDHELPGSFGTAYEQWRKRFLEVPRSVSLDAAKVIGYFNGPAGVEPLIPLEVRGDGTVGLAGTVAGRSGSDSSDPQPRAASLDGDQEEVFGCLESSQDGEHAPGMGASKEGGR